MNQDSELSPFTSNNNPNNNLSPKLQQVSSNLKLAGRVGFWIQIVLGSISTVMLLLAIANGQERSNPGVAFSLFCAVCGLICLVFGIYFSSRYTRTAKKFDLANKNTGPLVNPPKKADTLKSIKIGLLTSLIGMLVTIVGAEAIAGIALSKILSTPPGSTFNTGDSSNLVNSLDLLIVQANVNVIAAHFAGIASSLWLLHRITK